MNMKVGILIVILSIVMAIGSYWVGRSSTEDEYKETILQNEAAMKGLIRLNDSLTTRYELIVSDLDSAIEDNTTLREYVDRLERKYNTSVSSISHLKAFRDSVLIAGQSVVVPDSGCSGTIYISEDTLGVNLDAVVVYPKGNYELGLNFDPLELVIAVEETEDGLIRQSAIFPNQPWYTISKWDIIVEKKMPHQKGFFDRIFGELSNIGFTIGGNIGIDPVAMAAVTIGNTHVGVDTEQRIVLMRTFYLIE